MFYPLPGVPRRREIAASIDSSRRIISSLSLTLAISLRRTQFPSSSRNAGSEPVKLNVDQSIVDRPQLYIIAIQFSEAKNRTLGVCTVRESKNPYQRVMVLPVLKLGTLALKTLSKPIAARIKKEAGLHPKFRQHIVNLAQVLSLSKILG